MREAHLNDENIHQLIEQVFSSDFPVLIMELRGVYGLLAPHTLAGAIALNRAKERRLDKFYGTIAGSVDALLALAGSSSIIHKPGALQALEGCFIRFQMQAPGMDLTIRNGTHQVLLEQAAMRNVIQSMETYGDGAFPIPYPLCSSANMSGDEGGSITKRSKALSFASERGISLFIHTDMLGHETGSYPIIEEMVDGELNIVRHGPKGLAILERLQRLQSAVDY